MEGRDGVGGYKADYPALAYCFPKFSKFKLSVYLMRGDFASTYDISTVIRGYRWFAREIVNRLLDAYLALLDYGTFSYSLQVRQNQSFWDISRSF